MGDKLQYQYTLNDVLQELIQGDSFEELNHYKISFLKDLLQAAIRQIRSDQEEIKRFQTSYTDE